METIATLVGTSLATQESVPAAFAVLALAGDDPWLACRLGASVGGDCDTIAAMAGAMAGACCGVDALPVRAQRRAPGPGRPRRRAVGPAYRVADRRARREWCRCAGTTGEPGGDGRLVGVGSVVVDVLATVPELPPRGGDVWASRMRMAAGGGFHALAAAARQGVPVEYAGAHGTGPFGDLARAALAAKASRCGWRRAPTPTPAW